MRGYSKRAASVMPMRRITAWDGVLSAEVMDHSSGRPTPVKATSRTASAASVAWPWYQPISVPSAPGASLP
jgi:hypothetical protein